MTQSRGQSQRLLPHLLFGDNELAQHEIVEAWILPWCLRPVAHFHVTSLSVVAAYPLYLTQIRTAVRGSS